MILEEIKKSKLIFVAIMVGSFYLFLNLSKNVSGLREYNYLISFVFLEFGNLTDNVFFILRWIIPQIICIYIFYDYISRDFLDNSCLIFTRVNNKFRYFIKKSLNLLFNITIFFMFNLVPIFIYEKTYSLSFFELNIIILMIVYIYMIVLSINILNIFIDRNYSIITILLLQIISIMALNFSIKLNLSTFIFELNPFTSIFFINLNNNIISVSFMNRALLILSLAIIYIYICASIIISSIDLKGE